MANNIDNQEHLLNDVLDCFNESSKDSSIKEEKPTISRKEPANRQKVCEKYCTYLSCPVCGKIYYSRSGLTRHKMVHKEAPSKIMEKKSKKYLSISNKHPVMNSLRFFLHRFKRIEASRKPRAT